MTKWLLPNLAHPWGRVVVYVTLILGAAMLVFLVLAPNPPTALSVRVPAAPSRAAG